jgi:hypothetical protein
MAGGAGLPQSERPWLSQRTVDDSASRPVLAARNGAGYMRVADRVQGIVCKILDQDEVKPHKVQYYLE